MTPKEKASELFNYFVTKTGRYDVASDCVAKVVENVLPFLPYDKMINPHDNDCTEYWERVKMESLSV